MNTNIDPIDITHTLLRANVCESLKKFSAIQESFKNAGLSPNNKEAWRTWVQLSQSNKEARIVFNLTLQDLLEYERVNEL
jgi:hypothetical protein